MEYRRTDWTVHMGPLPDRPRWHQELYAHQAYQFPALDAALRFAKRQHDLAPERYIVIEYPDGRRWNGKEWE